MKKALWSRHRWTTSVQTRSPKQVVTEPVAAGQAPLGPDFFKGIAVRVGLVLLVAGAGVVSG